VQPGVARHATDPVNALLNYSYRLLEAEGVLAARALGLDPSLGILHANGRRPSFCLDLIEAVRPHVDRHVLRLLRTTRLRWRNFDEDARGVVRVVAPLTHQLAAATPTYAAALAPMAEEIVGIFAKASPSDVSVPSVLTREKHSRPHAGGLRQPL
jgi:hypothetical protein